MSCSVNVLYESSIYKLKKQNVGLRLVTDAILFWQDLK